MTPPSDWLTEAQAVTEKLYAAESTVVTSAAYSLTLQPSLADANGVTQTGRSLVVVAEVTGKIYVRVFDGAGTRIVDAKQPKHDHKASWYAQLATLLTCNWDQSKLKPVEISEVFRFCEMIIRRHMTSNIIESNEKLWKDDRIRNWMFALFNNKCWYSEAQESVSYYHVDHFRPKGRVSDDQTDLITDGYWWLAFNWTNYRISGGVLNSKKNDVFPYADMTRAVHNDPSSVAKECPILIDPVVEEEARLISYDWRDEETCIAVQAGGITPEQASRVDRTIEILGLNRETRLNQKRAQLWEKCRLTIADYRGAQGATCFALVEQKNAKRKLKEMISYDAEFSSVAEACVRKTAPEPLLASVFGH
ncbi:MAG: hypothetical protein NT069_30320 [Planctomycetota bacterium]|nr:hypothetical protein [Planctomycetota bacterium]